MILKPVLVLKLDVTTPIKDGAGSKDSKDKIVTVKMAQAQKIAKIK
jgi:hypothetical protein